jgi:threonine dehydrogenase-like Zn-dependent dehydrogenase
LNLAAQNGIKTYKVTTDCNFKELTRELGWFDLVVESTGTPQGIDHACKIVRPEGTVVLKTTSAQKTEFQASEITVNELNIVGSRCGDISQALYFLQKKWLDPLPLIEAIYPLNQYQQAFAKARQKGSKKVLLKISQ